jgi:hypothetical protein
MKRFSKFVAFFFVALLTVGSAYCNNVVNNTSQQPVFSIVGIPIGGNISNFVSSLQSKGFKFFPKYSKPGCKAFSGQIMGEKDIPIDVYFDSNTKQVYRVTAVIFQPRTFRLPKSPLYDKITKQADDKYGEYYVPSRSKDYYKTYTDGKHTFIAALTEEDKGYYIELVYFNIPNLKKKFKNDFYIPELTTTNKLLASLKAKGYNLEKISQKHFKRECLGETADIYISDDGLGRISDFTLEFYPTSGYYFHWDDSPSWREFNEFAIKQFIELYGTEGERKENDYIITKNNLVIKFHLSSGLQKIEVEYIKESPQRPGGDI